MSMLDRYIARHVLMATGLSLFVLEGLDMLFAFLDELDDLGEGYTLGKIVQYLLYSLPDRLYDMLPISALMGALIGLGMLAASSELTVMRAAGTSMWQLARSLFYPTFLIMLLVTFIGEVLVPHYAPEAESVRAVALGKQDKYASRYSVWHREGDTFMHFNAVDSRGVIYGVTEYQFSPSRELVSTRTAEQAQYQDGHWTLEHVQDMQLSQHEVKTTQQNQVAWNTQLTPELLRLVVLDPLYLSMEGLWHYGSYLRDQGLESDAYWLAFWQKLLQPIATLALVLVGMSFVFGPLRSVSMGQRVVSGLIVGVAFRLSQQLLGPVVTLSGVSPLLAVMVPIVLCVIAGMYLLRRVR
ncbi:LPS export ABC transporter permease LptG [Pokkaliibacter sp. MBI-7]|uniref:LPS export ABC transporter permease LptG n=1 Tax=Proteobacteria bacterium 228 TaxID=2083153 RepID=A0A2S5KM26_9PROT|nr:MULTISPECIES: LPS export ABC transporter permease LptG [Pokkaliibacter]MDH2431978.1 LPS export ABC transporter permease LptG [Pokkaliibacter sp. MBI-7]PPC75848.1 LPS export ABC transporter permease LptG [Pokkaliibacter plantistimulans]